MVNKTNSILLTVVLFLLLGAVDPCSAAIPGYHTIHSRVLEADFIFVARLHAAGKQEWPGGSLFRMELIEVLRCPDKSADLSKMLLDNAIPGSSCMGEQHNTPTDVDVVVFARSGVNNRLMLLSWCCNSIVPLSGTLEEYPGPEYKEKSLSGSEFVDLVRKQIERMSNFDYLKEAHLKAVGSRHPFNWHDKPVLLNCLLEAKDHRVEGFARELLKKGVSPREETVLLHYFARLDNGAGLPVLRHRFQERLQRWEAGLKPGEEDVDPEMLDPLIYPQDDQLLDISRILLTAGDRFYVRKQLLPAFEKGLIRAGCLLIVCGEERALAGLIKKIRGGSDDWKKETAARDAFETLVESGERSAILAAIRLAFEQKSLTVTIEMLKDVRHQGIGPGISFAPGWVTMEAMPTERDELFESWQAWWRQNAGNHPAELLPGAVDILMGPDQDWPTGS